ncbi:phage holin, LLH family [Paenibacillus sp. FJAT-26967]|uniref:phage holin, LLH family n=1 Tax=Paenibacillus sp. FJAT-26967 TaxID=1729690 RepID=UPI000838413D|nr:phage holin, LLH family [Paenibacillus sp. FJAT-26967]
MAQHITEILTPLILAFVTALAGVLTVAITSAKSYLISWIQARTNADQQELIFKVAREAMAYAENQDEFIKGKDKLNAAIDYAAKELQNRGVNVDRQKLLATVQDAWMEYNKPIQKTAFEGTENVEMNTTTLHTEAK